MAPRVTPLEGVSTSTVTPVDYVHTIASALAYVDERPQGAQPLTYALRGISVHGVENPQGFGIDERGFVASNPSPFIGSWDFAPFLFLSFSHVFASGTIRRVEFYIFGVIILGNSQFTIVFQKP